MPLPTLLWLQELNLGFFKTTSFVNVVVGCWTLITGVRWTTCIVLFPILISAVSTLKTPPPLKPRKFWRMPCMAKSSRQLKRSLLCLRGSELCLSVCEPPMLRISCLLFPSKV
ncbi:hypothetical protein HanPI659440_Chr13g0493561 [Helianthus annuus]|nr:hypothetical protein HanPI659440_Chr13g0493561 [Helianthus annuus]